MHTQDDPITSLLSNDLRELPAPELRGTYQKVHHNSVIRAKTEPIYPPPTGQQLHDTGRLS